MRNQTRLHCWKFANLVVKISLWGFTKLYRYMLYSWLHIVSGTYPNISFAKTKLRLQNLFNQTYRLNHRAARITASHEVALTSR